MAKAETEKTEKKAKVEISTLTGIPEIDAMMLSLSKDFGEDMSGEDYGNLSFTTSGSTKFDCVTGRGGIPNGRIIELIGNTGSMKTSVALAWIAQRQAWRRAQGITDKRDVILDLEHSLERSFIEGFGIDMSQVIWKRFHTSEEALQFLIQLVKSGHIDYALLDSVDAMQSETQLRKAVGDDVVGGIAKIMNFSLRQLTKLAPEFNSTLIFINQIKTNPMQMFGSPKVTPGGAALGYYARLRIEAMNRKDGIPDLAGAALVRLKIIKTSFGPPIEDEIELAFKYGKGFDVVYDTESLAKDLDILSHSAGQTKVRWTTDSDPVPLLPDIEKGKEAGQRALRENPQLVERLRHACLRAYKVPTARPDSDFTS